MSQTRDLDSDQTNMSNLKEPTSENNLQEKSLGKAREGMTDKENHSFPALNLNSTFNLSSKKFPKLRQETLSRFVHYLKLAKKKMLKNKNHIKS